MRGDPERNDPSPEGSKEKQRPVSTRQQYAIQLLDEGLPDAEVAYLVRISEGQLRRWKQNPRFRRARAEARGRPHLDPAFVGAAAEMRRQKLRRPRPETPWISEEKGGTS